MAIRLFLAVVAKSWKHCATRVFRSRWFRVLPQLLVALPIRVYSAHASRLCPERALNYRTLKTGGELDWENLAAEKQTLVFYMGLNQAATIQQKLIEHGMPGEMPVAIVENGTAVTQRVIDGTLTQLGELAQQMNSPSLIIIGRVVGLRDKLNWFSNH